MHIPEIGSGMRSENPVLAETTPSLDAERLVAVEAPLANQVVRGMLLTILTLGIYRFWYRTNLRRYYWGNTRLLGDAFEYTGTGKELFIGFLIALAIIVPLQVAISLATLFGGEIVGPIISFVIGAIVLPVLIQIALWRARRYRLTRTRYRGIRFTQSGTGTAYMVASVKWVLLAIVTLGIAFPYARRGLEKFRIENTKFGNAQGAFDAEARPLMKPWMTVWGALPVAGLLTLVGGPTSLMVAGLLPSALPFFWIWYRVTEFRHFTAGTRVGPFRFSSDLSTGSTIWIWVRYYLIMLGCGFGIAIAAAILVMPFLKSFDPNNLASLFASPILIVVVGIAFLGVIVLTATLTEVVLRRRLWALRVASVTVTGLGALDTVLAEAGQDATGIGEAFDTGFDIAG